MDHERRKTTGRWIALLATGVAGGCGEEPPPTSVAEFMENRVLLEAAMVRCVQNRTDARTDPECLNAREAAGRIAAREAEARRAELEAQSLRKREALRRAQEAAAAARRRALEEQRRQEEAELLGPFAPLPEGAGGPGMTEPEGVPGQGEGQPTATDSPGSPDDEPVSMEPEATPVPPTDASSGLPADTPSDLERIRRELQSREPEQEPQTDNESGQQRD